MNDELNKLGMAVHQAAQASQALEKLFAEAEARIGRIAEKDEYAKSLQAEIDKLSVEKVELEKSVSALKSEKARILASFSG